MALPVAPAPRSTDVAVFGWSGITVRIAWTLLAHGVRVKPEVLEAARTDALLHLDPHTSLSAAEDQAGALASAFVQRARGQRPKDPWTHDAAMPLSMRWRNAVENSGDQLTKIVFQKHYGDNKSLGWLEQKMPVDKLTLQTARAGIREALRDVACQDGLPLKHWPNPRIDQLLVRLAALSPTDCPPIYDVIEGAHREHVQRCTRCHRMHRLVTAGILRADDLVPPSFGARPKGHSTVLVLHFHPDGRHHRGKLMREFDAQAHPAGEDLLLIDAEDLEAVTETLVLASECGAPHRDHIRGVVIDGPGVWSSYGLLGPLAQQAEEAVEMRPWGRVEGLGELPEPLPEPPDARFAWAAVALMAAVALLLAWQVLRPVGPAVDHPLDVAFTEGRGGVWTAFDVDEEANVLIVQDTGAGLAIVLDGDSPLDKTQFAVGDGSYRLHTLGPGVLVASGPTSLAALTQWVDEVSDGPEPLAQLAEKIRHSEPRVDLEVYGG